MTDRLIIIGRIAGVHGVKGWMKIRSHTAPRENILTYPLWRVRQAGQWREMALVEGRPQGKGVVASLEGIDDREQARAFMGSDIAVPRNELPPLPEDEYYWADLEGLRVITVDGVDLGRVDHLIETGANDVMIVRGDRERLIPMVVGQYVTRVDLNAGLMEVDWDPDF